MKFNELELTKVRAKNRVGRGIAAGQGKTAGRGTKGQKARTGYSKKPGFSGGQNPLMQQLPKLPGFKSHRPKFENISTLDLGQLKASTIDAQILFDNKLVSSPFAKIKLLNSDKLTKALSVNLPKASQSAIDNIQQAGGSFNKTAVIKRPKTSLSTKKSSPKQ